MHALPLYGGSNTVGKPRSISEDPFKSAKWDELTAGRVFLQSDIPALEILCQWHAIANQCITGKTGSTLNAAAVWDYEKRRIRAISPSRTSTGRTCRPRTICSPMTDMTRESWTSRQAGCPCADYKHMIRSIHPDYQRKLWWAR